MPHPPELTQKILTLVERDYLPFWGHKRRHWYRIDLSIKGQFRPDITVLRDGKIVCVVEIGYTDPEKLAFYCAEKIPDIRWYSKSGLLYCVNRPARLKRPSGEFTDLIIGSWGRGVTGLVLR